MDVIDELGSGFDMSVGGPSGEVEWYIRNLVTGELTGPFSLQDAHTRVKKLKAMGGKFKVVHKRRAEKKDIIWIILKN